MKLSELPVLKQVFNSGAQDRVFDGLLLLGPPVVLLVAVAGRSIVTVGIASGYILSFVLYVLFKTVIRRRSGAQRDRNALE